MFGIKIKYYFSVKLTLRQYWFKNAVLRFVVAFLDNALYVL